MWPNAKDKSSNFSHARSNILHEPLWEILVPMLSKKNHIQKKSSRKFGRNFQKGPGGQISFKISQEPKTIKKKPYQEIGHGTQEYDLTRQEVGEEGRRGWEYRGATGSADVT